MDVVNNQILVAFKKNVAEHVIHRIHKQLASKVLEKNLQLNIYLISTRKNLLQTLYCYKQLTEVEHAEINSKTESYYQPNDILYLCQYGPQKIQAPSAWEITTSNGSVKIAIVDTGVELNHPDLATKLLPGYNFVDNNTNPNDGNGHGTHVAGIAAALTNNVIGIAGVAPSCLLIPVRILDNDGTGTLNNLINGIIYAADQGAQVINLSCGGPGGSILLENAVNYAWEKGCVVIGSAGSNGSTDLTYPAAYEHVISVTSTDRKDQKSIFANYGNWIDVCAPGSTILSTYLGGGYAYLSGSSMSSPHVSGIAALLASQGKNNSEIKSIILGSCDQIVGTGIYWRYGRVNANNAVHI